MLRLQQCSATVFEISENSILKKHASRTSYFFYFEGLTSELGYVKLGAVLLNFHAASKTVAFISDLEMGFYPRKRMHSEKSPSCHMHFFDKLLVFICSIPEDLM